MEEKIKELEKRVDWLYTMMYCQRARSVDRLIRNKVKDEDVLREEFECLLDCIEDERFSNQFWKLIKYVESFAHGFAAEFRRAEKVLTTGE